MGVQGLQYGPGVVEAGCSIGDMGFSQGKNKLNFTSVSSHKDCTVPQSLSWAPVKGSTANCVQCLIYVIADCMNIMNSVFTH